MSSGCSGRHPQTALEHRQRRLGGSPTVEQTGLLPVESNQESRFEPERGLGPVRPRVQEVEHPRSQIRVVGHQREAVELGRDRLFRCGWKGQVEQLVDTAPNLLPGLRVGVFGPERASLQRGQLDRKQRPHLRLGQVGGQAAQRALHIALMAGREGRQEEGQQGSRVGRVELQRGPIGGPGLVLPSQPVLEHPPLLDQDVGPVCRRGQGREPDLGVEQPDQVFPGPPRTEQTEERPGGRLKRRVRGERLGIGLSRFPSVAQPALAQVGRLVEQPRRTLEIDQRLEVGLVLVERDLLERLRLMEGTRSRDLLGRGSCVVARRPALVLWALGRSARHEGTAVGAKEPREPARRISSQRLAGERQAGRKRSGQLAGG